MEEFPEYQEFLYNNLDEADRQFIKAIQTSYWFNWLNSITDPVIQNNLIGFIEDSIKKGNTNTSKLTDPIIDNKPGGGIVDTIGNRAAILKQLKICCENAKDQFINDMKACATKNGLDPAKIQQCVNEAVKAFALCVTKNVLNPIKGFPLCVSQFKDNIFNCLNGLASNLSDTAKQEFLLCVAQAKNLFLAKVSACFQAGNVPLPDGFYGPSTGGPQDYPYGRTGEGGWPPKGPTSPEL